MRREERLRRRQRAFSNATIQRPRFPKRKRKRAALALSASAMALSGASHLALSSTPGFAQGMSIEASAPAELPVDPTVRRSAEELSVSDDLLEAMIEEEGVRYDVYRDVAGYPTVGVGHLVLPEDNLRVGDTIAHERAISLLENDLEIAEGIVRRLVGELPVNQHEFDALVDLAFNVGEGTLSPRRSPRLNRAIENGDYEQIANQLDYTTAGGRVARGLIHRSRRRMQIFAENDYSDPRSA